MLLETNQTKPSFIIMALNTDKDSTILKAHGIVRFKAVQGSYKGELETSYVIPFTTLETYQKALFLAKQYNQESILVVDINRDAELIYIDNSKTDKLGKFQCVSKYEALAQDSWTKDVEKEYYYVIK